MPSVDELRKMLRDARKATVPISKMKKSDVEAELAKVGLLSAPVAAVATETKPEAKPEAKSEAPKRVPKPKGVEPPTKKAAVPTKKVPVPSKKKAMTQAYVDSITK